MNLMTQRIFTLRIDWIFIQAPRFMRKVATSITELVDISTNCVFHILLEVSEERERLPFFFLFWHKLKKGCLLVKNGNSVLLCRNLYM
jgi:hypothetical protein